MFNDYASDDDHHIYKVDISNALNQKFITTDKGNKKAKKASQLKIKNEDATLIKIKKGKIVEYTEGVGQVIIAKLK